MSCNLALSGLAKDCETSMGGIVEVYFSAHDQVSKVEVTENVISAITMAEGAKFHKYFIRKGTSSMTTEGRFDAASGTKYYETNLAISFPKMGAAKRVEVNALAVNELAVIVKDANGVYWYLGYDNPVVASALTGSTGQAWTDANKYDLTVQDNAMQSPYPISEEIIATLVE